MLDMTTTPSPIPARADTLHRGDVVLFRFPCAEKAATEAPKARTCLVLDIHHIAGTIPVEIAYGTSVEARMNSGDDIPIKTPDEIAATGVHRPTRFVCARRITVPFDHPGWDINLRYRSPVLGRLPYRALSRMNAIRAKHQAFRDIAADRRATRSKPFVVEHRRRRTIARPTKEIRA